MASMLPYDLHFANEKVTSSASELCDPDFFCIKIRERDGGRCVVTDSPLRYCKCAHQVPVGHRKGKAPYVLFLSDTPFYGLIK